MRDILHLSKNSFSAIIAGLLLLCAPSVWGDVTLFNVNFSDETTEQIKASTSGASWVAKTYDGYSMSFGSKNADAGVIDIINGTGLQFTGNNMNNYNCLAIPLTLTAGNKVTAVVTLADATKIKYNWVSGSLPSAPNNGSSGTTYGTNSTTNTLEYTPASAGSYVLYLGRSGSSSGKKVVSVQITQAESACVAPTSVEITGTTSYTEGETITLTAAATGGTGTASYQWYKDGTAAGNKITGATSATFSKASCTTSDAGNYYCEVSTGATCSTFSSACAVSVDPVPAGTMVYLKPGTNWRDGGARFAVHYYGTGGSGWVSMESVETCSATPVYKAVIPSGYEYCIFCRMNGSTSENNWDNKWNQTGDLDVPTGDAIYYTVPDDQWDSGTSGWWQAKPLGVCVSGTWLAFKGEPITLNASCAGATHFQWYKDENVELTGQTSASLTITNCDYTDGGKYYCKAWRIDGDANKASSEWYGVRVPRLAIQTGGGGDRQDIAFVRANTSAETATCEVYLGVAWEYEFVDDDGVGTHGNTGTMNSGNCTGWTMDKENSNWCRIQTTKEGTYHFTMTFSNSTYTPVVMSVTYPPMVQTPGLKLYIENTPAMQERGWNNSSIYYRIGRGKYDDGDDRNWTAAQLMELVPGTNRYLYTTTPDWANDFWVWHIANNAGWVDGKYSIYKTKTEDSYAITESSNFNGDEVTTDRTIYLNSTSGGYGKDGMNSNCQFYGYTHSDGMVTHNFSTGATTHGQIRVEYTHHDNTPQSSEDYTARNFNGLAHTCEITITGVPDCGYRIKTLKVNGVDFTSGSIHILDADATVTAEFEIDTYTVTLHTNGGTINSGNVSEYTYLTGATLPTDVTKDGKSFDGWYDNSGLTGSPVSSITTTDCGNKEYWAKWGTCPALCSGETLYKFEVNSSVSDGNICSSGNNPKELTTPTQLSTLIGGSLEGYISNNSNWNNLVYSGGRITYKNGDKGVLILTLNCPIKTGDIIRFNNYSGSNGKYNYLRHTSNSTTSGQLTLSASKTASEIQSMIAPAAFDGKTVLYIVSGSNTTGISYFEIIRPIIVTLDANGGTVEGNATKELRTANAEVVALPHAFKDGYRFKGWFDAPSGGSPASDNYTVTSCVTLYAQYEDCPDRGMLYKFEVKTGLTNGAVTANNVAFDFNTNNYLTTLIGGTLTTAGDKASKVVIANTNAISMTDNGAYLKIDLDCEIEEGDVFKSTIANKTVYVSKEASRTNTVILPVGTLVETPIPAALVGEKTLYLWKGEDGNAISYFEITRSSRTVITLDATGANNHYTTSVIAKYGSEMPSIDVLPTRAGYVFDGYYDGAGGTGTQYYTATGASAQDWDKDVKTATLYAKWLTPCETKPTLTNVAPVVTIWDQHPVDISLVKLSCLFDTTDILHYSLASISPVNPIPGCEFKYFDDYIHIMGTPTLFNASVETVDVTFTITNDCSPATTATITQTIQIYPKNQKARIAFIVTGTKGGAFDACTAGDMTASNTLVTYLRESYTVDFVNGYATKDPATLATYYDDYDLLVVTDFLETGEGYTNAIGTLIDKKPILSFEAYVANLPNWHIGSNPKDPDPKVQDMKVLCAGHAIFSDDDYHGTPVDVVNADTMVHVLDALSSAEKAKGLQGFTINEAPDFIFLATVRDANNKRDLVVCCERQVVFPARLLLYGINFYEMPNLSPAGQIIIRQMIDYLLMTDETKVADCSLVFDNGRDNTEYNEAAYHAAGGTGTKGDGLWTTAANWAPGYNIIPTPYHPTRIIAECHVNVDNAHAGSVKVNKGRDEHNNPVDGKLIVLPYGGLTVAGMVAKVNDTRYASPIAIKADELFIQADAANNGAFVYGNKESDVRATVQYYSRGDDALTSSPVWQYMGIPFQAGHTAIDMYRDAWMCRWTSATTDDLGGLWQWVENEDVLIPFEGYCITQASTKTYEFAGKLNPPVTTTLILDNRDGDGYAFAANSWTAPIKIQEMADEDFINTEKAIYIYHSGTWESWNTNKETVINAKSSDVTPSPGQYAVIPIHSSPYIGVDSVIPAMQGFFVKTNSADAQLKLVYNRVVYDATYFKTSTQPMRAPRRNGYAPEVMVLNVAGASFGDRVHLLSRGGFSEEYEDGWDGRKIEGDLDAPKLAVVKEAGEMAVAAVETADEHYLSFRAGKDSAYTFSFDYEGDPIYLYDQLTGEATLIQTGNTYAFAATNKTPLQRFLITTNPPRTPTAIEPVGAEQTRRSPEKFIHEGGMYILHGGAVYDALGKRVIMRKEGEQ